MPADAAKPSAIERLVRQDRAVIAIGLLVVTAVAWRYLLRQSAEMDAMDAMGMPEMRAWMSSDVVALFTMWSVMMVAMMLPSAAPVVLLTAGTYRRRGGRDARVATPIFVAGYLVMWTAFSAVAALAQYGLHRAALLSPAMATSSTALAGAVLIVAGVYQWLPVKGACLSHCRSPLGHLTREWRDGLGGAFVMGVRHGTFCVGCCWALMALLFVAGVMNLVWVAAIAVFVLVEKVTQAGPRLGQAAGVVLVCWGAVLVARTF